MYKVGDKVGLNKEKLKYYCDKHKWNYKNMCSDLVEIIELNHINMWGYKAVLIKDPKTTTDIPYHFYVPVDCIDMREMKIRKILCIK